jgi:hypothetical protein
MFSEVKIGRARNINILLKFSYLHCSGIASHPVQPITTRKPLYPNSLSTWQIHSVVTVPNKETGSCLDPELSRTSLQSKGDEGPGLSYFREKSQLEPSRDGENTRRSVG